ncbi:MAG: hypothetical protein ABJA37_01350, partial [Ferruginibacter sp.]
MLIEKKFSFFYIFYCLVVLGIILIVKAYIIAALLIPFIVYIILNLVDKVKSPLFKVLTIPILTVFFVLLYNIFAADIDNALGAFAVDKLSESVTSLQKGYSSMGEEDAGSNFDIGTIEPNLPSLISKIPTGFVATLYRPFIWEIRKPIMIFSALESLFLLIFTIHVFFKTGILFFIRQLFTNPLVSFFLIYSIIFAGFVGISTMNFG